VSIIAWIPTSTSTPIHARLTIHGDAWIPTIPIILAPRCTPIIPATFTEFLSTLDRWETELFSDLTMDVDCYKLLDLVNNQTTNSEAPIQLLTMSDGSDYDLWVDYFPP
jgi:hypothetical protein